MECTTSLATPPTSRRRSLTPDIAVDLQAIIRRMHGSGHEHCEARTIIRQSLLNGPSTLSHVIRHLRCRHDPRSHRRNKTLILGSTRPPPHLLEGVRPELRDELRCSESLYCCRGFDGPHGCLHRPLGRWLFQVFERDWRPSSSRDKLDKPSRRYRCTSPLIRVFAFAEWSGK